MKLFVTSDIHGFFTPFIKSLNEAGFEPNNPNHLLIVCGDLLDRGREPNELIDYLQFVSNKVLVKGNHEDLFEQLLDRGFVTRTDIHNRTAQTVLDLSHEEVITPYGIQVAYEKFKPLLEQMVDYFETKNYIFTHSTLPMPNGKHWKRANCQDFYHARWGNPFLWEKTKGNKSGKIVVHGHWHNSYYWASQGKGNEFDGYCCFDICYHGNCIGLDACTAFSGLCNVLVIEDELLNA